MNTAKRVVCFGEFMLRLAAPGRELLLQSPRFDVSIGGAEANVAVALACFGHQAKMLSVVPDSQLGRAAVSELRRHGVDTSAVATGRGRMGLYFLSPGAVRRPSEIIYDRADSAFARGCGALDFAAAVKGADWFHISGVTPALGHAAAQAAVAAASAARAAGATVSFDGNYRAKLWEGRRGEAPAILRRICEQCDVLFGDDRDIGLLLEKDFAKLAPEARGGEAAQAAFAAFPQLERIAATKRVQHGVDDHDLGAVMFTRARAHSTPMIALRSIVDRVGAGDAFAAGVIHGLLTGQADAEALRFGWAAACLKHSLPGDFLALGEADVRAALSDHGFDVKR